MKLKTFFAAVLIVAVSFLYSCSKSAPACADERTTGKVVELMLEQTEKEIEKMRRETMDLGISTEGIITIEEIKKEGVFKVVNIRTQSFQKDTGRYDCAADLSIEFRGKKDIDDITYTSELLEGQAGFYVTLQGLEL